MVNKIKLLFVAIVTVSMLNSGILYAYEEIDIPNGGSISGNTLFLDEVPTRAPIEILKDKDVCAVKEHLSEALIVSADKGIKNVIVSIMEIEKGKKIVAPDSNPTIDQKGCTFIPHVLCITAGTTIDILNSDSVTHNVHTYPEENTAVNKAQPSSLKKISLATEFGEEDPMKIGCDYHGWMGGWIGIFEHPYFALTGDDGSFTISNIPPGVYEVKAWQEDLGELIKTISVKAGEMATENFEFKK